MHGMTDGPMNPLSGSGLAYQWCEDGRNPEYTASDGTFIHCQATLDFDYEMGYLLKVQSKYEAGEHTKWDWLFVYIKHGGCEQITCEWAQAPIHFDWMNADHERINAHNVDVIRRWVDWVYAVEKPG